MKYKVAELEGALLDAAVAKALDWRWVYGEHTMRLVDGRPMVQPAITYDDNGEWFEPSQDWAQGGPIIERERITVLPAHEMVHPSDWRASTDRLLTTQHEGSTPLIAAMRAYVASKFGEEVELP